MRKRLPNTVHDWEKMLKRAYETQGPSGLAKYQYSVSSILHLTKTSPSLQRMLEYCKDIPNPKGVLIDAISEVMLNHAIATNARIAATATLETMKEVLAKTREESL